MAKVTHALSIIHRDYYNAFYMGLPAFKIVTQKLHLLQTALAQVLAKSRATVELGILHWLPIFPSANSTLLNCFIIQNSTLIGSFKQFYLLLSFLLMKQKIAWKEYAFYCLLYWKNGRINAICVCKTYYIQIAQDLDHTPVITQHRSQTTNKQYI